VELIRNAHSDIWLLIDKLRLSQIIRNLGYLHSRVGIQP
jgi:hypothetical protein